MDSPHSSTPYPLTPSLPPPTEQYMRNTFLLVRLERAVRGLKWHFTGTIRPRTGRDITAQTPELVQALRNGRTQLTHDEVANLVDRRGSWWVQCVLPAAVQRDDYCLVCDQCTEPAILRRLVEVLVEVLHQHTTTICVLLFGSTSTVASCNLLRAGG